MKSDGTVFNFNIFKGSLELASDIYNNKALLEKEKNSQYKMLKQLNDLKEFDPTNRNKTNCKKETLFNAEKVYKNRDNVIKAFENGVSPFEESASQEKQVAKDLKIQARNQMFSRLPIFLAQLKAGNNSKKRRQLLYSLYKSKKLTKQLCKSFIHII